MDIGGKTILITGGATGIGFALAERFSAAENRIIICSRKLDKLAEAKKKLPEIQTAVCDISDRSAVEQLAGMLKAEYGRLDILVNNAGVQRRINLAGGTAELEKIDDEININLRAQIYVAMRFVPLLAGHDSAIVNVSSGLGFVPMAAFPVYSATKAGIHSFTLSLRRQLRNTQIRVFEAIPPTVHDTLLKGKQIEKTDYSISASEMADAIVYGILHDTYEISAGAAKRWLSESREDLDGEFERINR